MTKPQLHDVARAAGVSLATVDRALHRRPGVKNETIARVDAAVLKLGYRADFAATRLARSKPRRIRFLLPSSENSFVNLLTEQINGLMPWFVEQRVSAAVTRIDSLSATQVANKLHALRGHCDAVVVMAVDHALVRAAIDDLVDSGIVVITLVSDVPTSKRHQYVGINNISAGRVAASLMGRFMPTATGGEIAVALGSRALRDHAERLFGFEQVIRAEFPHLTVLEPFETHEDSRRSERLVNDLLKKQQLLGLYSVGGGNRGIFAALKARQSVHKVIWICHELTRSNRDAILSGHATAVINQDAGHEIRSSVRQALARLNNERLLEDQERIHIDIFMRDNLP